MLGDPFRNRGGRALAQFLLVTLALDVERDVLVAEQLQPARVAVKVAVEHVRVVVRVRWLLLLLQHGSRHPTAVLDAQSHRAGVERLLLLRQERLQIPEGKHLLIALGRAQFRHRDARKAGVPWCGMNAGGGGGGRGCLEVDFRRNHARQVVLGVLVHVVGLCRNFQVVHDHLHGHSSSVFQCVSPQHTHIRRCSGACHRGERWARC